MQIGKIARRAGPAVVASALALSATAAVQAQTLEPDRPVPSLAYQLADCEDSLGDPRRYRRCDIPDFDQKWSSLPAGNVGEGGDMYCVPTGTLNVLAWLADHGAEWLAPYPGYTDPDRGPNDYGAIPLNLAALGLMMGTDGDGGTTDQPGWYPGVTEWMNQSLSYATDGADWADYFTIGFDSGYERDEDAPYRAGGYTYSSGGSAWVHPSVTDMAEQAASGYLLMPNVVWSQELSGETPLDDGDLVVRFSGGHFLTLSGATLNQTGDRYQVALRDPDTDEDDNTRQSRFVDNTYPATPDNWRVTAGANSSYMYRHYITRIEGYGSAWLAAYGLIGPKRLVKLDPLTLKYFSVPSIENLGPVLELDGMGPVADLLVDPLTPDYLFLLSSGDLTGVDPLTGAATVIARIGGGKRLAQDRNGRTHVLAGTSIVSLQPDGATTAVTELPEEMEELAYDATTQHVLALDQDASRLYLFEPVTRQTAQACPPTVDCTTTENRCPNDARECLLPLGSIELPALPPKPRRIHLSVNGRSGDLHLLPDAGTRLLRGVPQPGREIGGIGGYAFSEIALQSGGQALSGLVADDGGLVYAVGLEDQRLHAFDGDGSVRPTAPFHGQTASPLFRITQSAMRGPAPSEPNVLPEDAPKPQVEIALQGQPAAFVGNDVEVDVQLVDHLAGVQPGERALRYGREGAHPQSGALGTDTGGRARLAWTGAREGRDFLVVWEDADGDQLRDRDEAVGSLSLDWVAPEAAFTIEGFFRPVLPLPEMNRVQAAAVVPLKWRVHDADGALVADPAVVEALVYREASCETGEPAPDAPRAPAAARGGTTLRWDEASSQFVFDWSTPRSPGRCLRLQLELSDGTDREALFRLK